MKTMVATLAMMLLASLPVAAEFGSIFDDGDPIVGATYVDGEYKTQAEGEVYVDFSDAVWGNTTKLILTYRVRVESGWQPVAVVHVKPDEGWESNDSRRFDFDNGITITDVSVWREYNATVSGDDGSVSKVKGRY